MGPTNRKSLAYLDRHSVKCPAGYALATFMFRRDGCSNHKHKKFNYSCMKVQQGTTKCTTSATAWKSNMGRENLEFLDRLTFSCPSNKVMTGFRYDTNGDSMRGKSTCCTLGDKQTTLSCGTMHTSCNPIRKKKIEFLDRHTMNCGARALTKFKLIDGSCGGNGMRYEYTCCRVPPPFSPPPPLPPPPYALHVASIHMRTTRKDQVKSDDYNAEGHEFHRCMAATNNTPTDPAYADWTSDGKASSKLDDIKAADLLDPIGKLRENGEFIHVYDARKSCSKNTHPRLTHSLFASLNSGGERPGAGGERNTPSTK